MRLTLGARSCHEGCTNEVDLLLSLTVEIEKEMEAKTGTLWRERREAAEMAQEINCINTLLLNSESQYSHQIERQTDIETHYTSWYIQHNIMKKPAIIVAPSPRQPATQSHSSMAHIGWRRWRWQWRRLLV